MVKPQFEVGAKFLKKGVVRDESVQKRAVEEIIAFAKGLDFEYVSQAPSRLKGPKGNQEYFIHLKKK
jgi:23S rRNA (cytidine1920-2'-O)/16S rRNA (cytidine1409-2'-O)-methyltransferase